MENTVVTIAPSIIPKSTLRVAAYCRVSSDSSDQLHSFAAQVQHYTKFISDNERMELADIYADEGITGTKTSERDDFNRLIADCKKGKIDRVLTKSVSRFARNTADSLMYARLLKEYGISILFEKENIDTSYMSNELLLALSGAQAQEESISISKNMRRRLFHNTDSRLKNSEKWFCKNEDCQFSVYMTVAELEQRITEVLNLLISNYNFTEYEETDISAEPSLEICKMENEIERLLESIDFDKTEIQNMILQCAAKKYDEYKSVQHITERLKADFEKSSLLSAFNMELFDRTVSAVMINKDKKVSLKLKNDKIIWKELLNGDANTVCTEISQNHTTET